MDMRIEIAGRAVHCREVGEKIGVNLGAPRVGHWPIELGPWQVYVLNTGVPHAVLFVEDILDIPFIDLAKEVRSHPAFAPEGVNVNFAQVTKEGALLVRTYERGVEGETLSCGTGAAAAAWAAVQLYGLAHPLAVQTRRSMQSVSFEESLHFSFLGAPGAKEIEMIGPALLVFSGQIEI